MKTNLLRAEIVARGLTMSQVAAGINLHKNTFSQKMTGKVQFNTDEIMRLCDFLDITDPAKKVAIFLS